MVMSENFRHKLVIVKADDFGRGPLADPWRRFVDLCLLHNVVPSLGVVGQGLNKSRTLQSTARYLSEAYEVEFWNHSNAHHDITKMVENDLKKDTLACQQTIEDCTGRRPCFYGAPFNAVSARAISTIESTGEFSGFYFADGCVDSSKTVSKTHLITPEFSTQVLNPVRQRFFEAKYSTKSDKDHLVLQLHPAYWSDRCFIEFERTLLWCLERNYQAVTLGQYFSLERQRNSNTSDNLDLGAFLAVSETIYNKSQNVEDVSFMPDLADRKYYFGRLRGPLVSTARFLKAHGLTQALGDRKTVKVLDVGAGAGDWSLACIAIEKSVHATAYDRNAALGGFVSEVFRSATTDRRWEYKVGDAARLDFLDNSIDHVLCNNALNYMLHDQVLPEIARVMCPDGLLLLGVQNELYPLLDALRFLAAKDSDGVISRLDRYFYNNLRRSGVIGTKPFINYWNDREIVVTARFSGLHSLLRGMELPVQYGRLFQRPVLWGYLFIRTEASRRNSEKLLRGDNVSSEDEQTLASAGAFRPLLDVIASQQSTARNVESVIRLFKAAVRDDAAQIESAARMLEAKGLNVPLAVQQVVSAEARLVANRSWAELQTLICGRSALSDDGIIAISWAELRQTGRFREPIVADSYGISAAVWKIGQAALQGDWSAALAAAEDMQSRFGDIAMLQSVLSGEAERLESSISNHPREGSASSLPINFHWRSRRTEG